MYPPAIPAARTTLRDDEALEDDDSLPRIVWPKMGVSEIDRVHWAGQDGEPPIAARPSRHLSPCGASSTHHELRDRS